MVKYIKKFVSVCYKKDLSKLKQTGRVKSLTLAECQRFDLQRMGHKLSGFFPVKRSKKIETIYCDFFPNIHGSYFKFFFYQNGFDMFFILPTG